MKRARQIKESDPTEAIRVLQDAVSLYHGEFLEDLQADWATLCRESATRVYLEALLMLGQLLFNADRYAEATDVYHRVIAHDRLLEAAHRELMRCYARQGERGLALRHYQTLVDLLHDELGVPPADETMRLVAQLRTGGDSF